MIARRPNDFLNCSEMFKYEHTVIPDDVDEFHVVHFSKYLIWFTQAILNMFKNFGLGAGRFDNNSVEIRVARIQAAYIESARLNDNVEVTVLKLELRNTVMVAYVKASTNGRLLARARVTVACVSAKDGQMVKLPEEVKLTFDNNRP